MTIGQLYNVNNVVVGQAVCMIAPANTPVPNIALVNQTTDPFQLAPWQQATVQASATISAGSFTLTYVLNGVTYGPTTSQTATTATAAALDAAITAILPGAGANDVVVTGGPVSATATPFQIMLSEAWSGGTWTLTPTGITGGTLAIVGPLWVPVGATDQGWKWGAAKTPQDIMIEEQSTPVATTINSQKITVEGALSEDISRTLALAFNMTNGYTANAVGLAGFETLTLTDTPLQYAVALIMANQLGLSRWLYIPVCTSLSNVDVTLRRSAAKRMYSVALSSICATSSIQLFNVLQKGQ